MFVSHDSTADMTGIACIDATPHVSLSMSLSKGSQCWEVRSQV